MENKKTCSTCPTSMILGLFRGSAQDKIITGIRIVFGLGLALAFGLWKLTGWIETWIMYGSTMQYLGIWFWFVFWGLMAWLAELVWWIALALWYRIRIAAIFITFVMLVATIGHLSATEWMLAEMSPMMAIVFGIMAIIFAIFPDKWNSVCDKC